MTATPSSLPVLALPGLAGLALIALLAFAVRGDLAARRIPNRLVAAGLVLALALHGLAGVLGVPSLAGRGAAAPLLGAVIEALVLAPLYLARACAAGDVKLAAMSGSFLGPWGGLAAGLATLLAGGALALMALGRPGVASAVWQRLRPAPAGHVPRVAGDPLARTAFRLPYAVAIALGTSAVLARIAIGH